MGQQFFRLAFLLGLLSVLTVTCKKEEFANNNNNPELPGFSIPTSSPVQGSVSGIVVDENNSPVSAARVTYAGINYQTDAKGFFTIKNVTLDKYISTIKVNVDGYFEAVRSFSASASHNYVAVKLIRKQLAGTVNSSSGGAVSLPNGASITLPVSGIIVKSTAAAYNGIVEVYAAYIDPTAPDFAALVPGSMMGQDTSKMFVLQSTGMIAVNLESSSGEVLQLAPGKPASITLPIPTTLVNKAPAQIDTWSLDERGIWIKEGTAAKNGSNYSMQVNHFSFWNCDVPSPAVYLDLYVQNQNNQPVSNSVVSLTIPNNNNWWATTYGITDSTGHTGGLVPAAVQLEMKIFASSFNCLTPVHTQNIGPLASDTSLHVGITVPQSQMLTVTGTVNNCSNQPVQNGVAVIYSGTYGIYHTPVVNGTYNTAINYCDNSNVTLSVIATDFSSLTQATSGVLSISGNTITVPMLITCNSMANASYSILSCTLSGSYQTNVPMNAGNFITTTVEVTAVGNYSLSAANGWYFNGIRFVKSGVFTTTGVQTIQIPAAGTPLATGSHGYFLTGDNASNYCFSLVNFTEGPPASPAVFSFEGPGLCQLVSTWGEDPAGLELTNANYVEISVNVSAPGAYAIHTGSPVNGVTYRDTGIFRTTGTQVVRLRGSGVPAASGSFQYQVQANNIMGCSFSKTFQAAGPMANITFLNSPGTCNIVSDPVRCFAGIPMKNEWFSVRVISTNAGWCRISTETINGVKFSGNAYLQGPNEHTVILMPSGTPVTWRNDTFTPVASNQLQGCTFTVQAHTFNSQ